MMSSNPKNIPLILTESEFHNAIHEALKAKSISSESKIRTSNLHSESWIETSVNLKTKVINISIYVDFKTSKLTSSESTRLQLLFKQGISNFWGRSIQISTEQYLVNVNAIYRAKKSLDAKLKISTSSKYARSHNSGFIDATFIYNKGYYNSQSDAERVFKLVCAHEIGHSVLKSFGGIVLSWGHKGSTGVVTQKVKITSPMYPVTGTIDLLKYYNNNPNVRFSSIYLRTKATEIDVKRLIWLSKTTVI